MNNNATITRLNQMRLWGMAQVHSQHLKDNLYASHTLDQYAALLTDQEWEGRQNKKIERLMKMAGFRISASLTDVDYASARNLDRNIFDRLASLGFIRQKENLIITGPTGVGKSYLAQAIGNQACLLEHKVMYALTSRLFSKLKVAKLEGSYLKEIEKIQKTELLILDDFGLQPFDNHHREALLDIMEDRYNKSSVIIATQIPVAKWHELIGEGTIADAILDRLVNSSHRLELKGQSLRKKISDKK
ncbi:MAG: IS21-like element helper ATPase IstB [Flavobacteriales bacterium]